jgi:hypothetical protein
MTVDYRTRPAALARPALRDTALPRGKPRRGRV